MTAQHQDEAGNAPRRTTVLVTPGLAYIAHADLRAADRPYAELFTIQASWYQSGQC